MFCQRCRKALKFDSSLEDTSPAALKLLTEAISPPTVGEPSSTEPARPLYTEEQKQLYDEASKDAASPTFTKVVPPPPGLAKEQTGMSFVMLTDSHITPPSPKEERRIGNERRSSGRVQQQQRQSNVQNGMDGFDIQDNLLSTKMETNMRLFEILSSRTDIDHPICAECTEQLLERMEKRLADTTRERDAYSQFLNNANADVPTEEERQLAAQELEAIKKEEQEAFEELERLEKEKADLEEELVQLEKESAKLDKEEEQFWRERNELSETLNAFREERDSLTLRLQHDSKQLERLQRTNVYSDTFNISYDGIFATINGLRLGRVSNSSVDWPEINAAWGQTCLLLATVAEKLGYEFQGYHLIPMGSTSYVEKLPASRPAEGSGSSALPSASSRDKEKAKAAERFPLFYDPSLLSFHRNFDEAMVSFLECLRQLGKYVEQKLAREPSGVQGKIKLELPVKIEGEKIGGVSIKPGGIGVNAGDENWTKACKYVLICAKFLLAHASSIGARGGPGQEQTRVRD